MRCTKCHYLSFEPEPRCRNCGHDLSLDEGSPFNLANAQAESREEAGGSGRAATAVLNPPKTAVSSGSSRIPTADLPLFVRSMQGVSDQLAHADDAEPVADHHEDFEPLVKVPARPRTPVSVRRATPDPARLRAKYGLNPNPEPDLWSNIPDPLDDMRPAEEPSAFQDLPLTSDPSLAWSPEPVPSPEPIGWTDNVGVSAGARLIAAFIDASVLAGISAAILYFTLQVAGLSLSQIALLPMLPIIGLLLIMTTGYMLMFTAASGQTLGKMAMNIRVVGTSPEAVYDDRVSASQAALRAIVALPSVLLLGIGFLPALVGAGLAFHDRIAHTRVVRL